MLASGQVVPARIGGEIGVLADMGDEVACVAVVEADASSRPLTSTDRILPPLVCVHPVVLGPGDMAGDSGPGGRPKKGHAFGPLGNRKKVGRGQQVVEENLQPTVKQRRTGDVALVPSRAPEVLVHLHVKQEGPRDLVQPDPLDGPEEVTVLERVAEHRLKPIIEVAIVRKERGLEVGGVDVIKPSRHIRNTVNVRQADLSAAMKFTPGVNLIGT